MEYTPKQVHYLWSSYNQEIWRLDPDPMTSARMILEREKEHIEIVPILKENGMFTLGFALKNALSLVGEAVEEAALDGTCMFPNCNSD
jgi:hypothetical protein